MLKADRHNRIIEQIQSKGAVEISQLRRIFDAGEMTVRRDLDELAARGLVIRTHGGATLPEGNSLIESPFKVRLNRNMNQKKAIARRALDFIKDGQRIFIDSGTTAYNLAQMIDDSKKIVVVTNAVNIAIELNERINISVISVGGELKKNTYSCTGFYTEDMIRKLKTDMAFVGVSGIGADGELYNVSVQEVGVKKAIMESTKDIVILADSSKIGFEEFASFGNLKAAGHLITDAGASEKILDYYRKLGTEIIIAS